MITSTSTIKVLTVTASQGLLKFTGIINGPIWVGPSFFKEFDGLSHQ
jgi:hypothetical protein